MLPAVSANPHRQLCPSLQEVAQYYQDWQEKRHQLAYMTDGVVVKINDLQRQNRLGFTQKFPRWAIALKYPAEEVPTVVKDIIVNVAHQVIQDVSVLDMQASSLNTGL